LHQQSENDQEALIHDEVTIINSVLDLVNKSVKDVMTPINNVFYLHHTDLLDKDMIARIVDNGYSRIPILSSTGKLSKMLLVKSLIGYDSSKPVKVGEVALHDLYSVSEHTNLFDTLNYFQQGGSTITFAIAHIRPYDCRCQERC
jgi:metal transporter CNNM